MTGSARRVFADASESTIRHRWQTYCDHNGHPLLQPVRAAAHLCQHRPKPARGPAESHCGPQPQHGHLRHLCPPCSGVRPIRFPPPWTSFSPPMSNTFYNTLFLLRCKKLRIGLSMKIRIRLKLQQFLSCCPHFSGFDSYRLHHQKQPRNAGFWAAFFGFDHTFDRTPSLSMCKKSRENSVQCVGLLLGIPFQLVPIYAECVHVL